MASQDSQSGKYTMNVAVGGEGQIGYSDMLNYMDVRPAFCLSGDLEIETNNEIVEGEEVYILKCPDIIKL